MKNKLVNLLAMLTVTGLSASALAQEASAAAGGSDKGLIALAAGIAISLAVLGGTLGQGKAVAAALDGVARNPAAQAKILIPMILGLAFIESLVVLAFLIATGLRGLVG